MTVTRAVRIWAGFVILLSLALAQWVSPKWLYLTAFAGFNMLQSGITGFCPAEKIFSKILGKNA